MNTDLELLQAAAKAAGLNLNQWPGEDFWRADHKALGEHWNPRWSPLESDGDAMRLAVDLQMDMYVRAEWVEAVAPRGAPQKVRYGLEGPRKAARLAITRAAAAMPARRVLGAA